MAASRSKTFRLGFDLDDGASHLAHLNGYTSAAGFIKGLIRYALLCQARHTVSLPWSQLSLEEQDKLDAALLVLVQAGRGMRSDQAAKITVAEIVALAEKVKGEKVPE